MKTAIVTGASGFIGKKLVNYLVSKNVFVYAVVRNEKSNINGISNAAKIIYAENLSFDKLLDLQKDTIDIFYHLAWEGSTGINRNNTQMQQKNQEATLNAYKIANDLGCKKFISTGTISEKLVEQNEINKLTENLVYAVTKHSTYLMLDKLSSTSHTKLIWAQLANLYGTNNNTGNIISYTLDQLMNHQIPEYTKALQPYDFMYADDAVHALYLLAETDNLKHNKYFIGSGKPRLLKEYLLEIASLFGDDNHIKLGARPDDGFVYHLDWFDTKDLVSDTGFKTSDSFKNHMSRLIKQTKDMTMNKPFLFKKTELEGAYLINPFVAMDERGLFVKDYSEHIFMEHGINLQLKEVFYTHSKKGVLRGIHFQRVFEQAKLIRCISGKIFDVIVDLRKDSITYGKWQAFELSGEHHQMLYVPKHFGHGYLVLEDSIVSYQVDEKFHPEYDDGIIYNDQDLSIPWPIKLVGEIILSKKDKELQTFSNFNHK